MDRAAPQNQRRSRPQRQRGGRAAAEAASAARPSPATEPTDSEPVDSDSADAASDPERRPSRALVSRESSDKLRADECLICVSPRQFTAIGPCNHPICHTCALRIRTFNKRSKDSTDDGGWGCPTCRTELTPLVIFEGSTARPFDRQALQYLPKDAPKHLYYDSEVSRKAANEVTDLYCTVCPAAARTTMRDMKILKRHLSQEHSLFECEICAAAQMLFPWERKLYTRKELVQHKRSKATDGKPTHPRCEFCDLRFFSADELSIHMDREHERCHLCEKAGKKYEFYVNYEELEAHFGAKHHLCPNEGCRKSRFVVYASASLLDDHIAAVHQAGSRGGKIELTRVFRNGTADTRRRGGGSGKDADAPNESEDVPEEAGPPPADLFDGPSLHAAAGVQEPRRGGGDVGGGSWVTPGGGRHVGSRGGGVEDFPALHQTAVPKTGGSEALWGVSQARPKNTVQPNGRAAPPQTADFPSLGGKSGAKRPAILGRSRHGVVPRPTQPKRAPPKTNWNAVSAKAPAEPDPELMMYSHPSYSAEREQAVPTMPPQPKSKPLSVAELSSTEAFPSLGGAPPSENSEWSLQGNGPHGHHANKGANLIPSKLSGGTVEFVEPADCRARNGTLIALVREVCSDEQFSSFKQSSGQLRSGEMTPGEFFTTCVDVLGQNLAKVFPELVALLPNIALQQALYATACEWDHEHSGSSLAGTSELTLHPKSGQILITADVAEHDRHLETIAFPSLDDSKSKQLKPQKQGMGTKQSAKKKKAPGVSSAPSQRTKPTAKTGTAGGSRKDYRTAQPQSQASAKSQWGTSAQYDW